MENKEPRVSNDGLSREIKFRALYSGEMTYISLDEGNMWILHELVDTESLTQYTGLKDKNGKEIYEGDILADTDDVCVVQFFKGNYVTSSFLEDLNESNTFLKVIGNIFEHPHLLETDQPTT